MECSSLRLPCGAGAASLPFSASTFDTPLRPRTLGRELGLSEMLPNGLSSKDGCLSSETGRSWENGTVPDGAVSQTANVQEGQWFGFLFGQDHGADTNLFG